MAHGYRTLQNWEHWLISDFLGNNLLQEEGATLAGFLTKHFGKHAVLIGVPPQRTLLSTIDIPCQTIVTPPIQYSATTGIIENDLHELPIQSGCVDLVVLPHTLEFVDNPRQLLAEACRIVKPEGLIAIFGFNPFGTWNLRKWISNGNPPAWAGNFIPSYQVKGWLKLADFSMEGHAATLFRPPMKHYNTYNKFQFLEKFGRTCLSPFSGAYLLVARAKVIPLTPIKMKWKQHLSGIRISTTFSGHIAQ